MHDSLTLALTFAGYPCAVTLTFTQDCFAHETSVEPNHERDDLVQPICARKVFVIARRARFSDGENPRIARGTSTSRP